MSAIISPCGTWRYRLDREVDGTRPSHVVAFFGVNPSTADASVDDSTIRKLRGFAQLALASRFIVANPFAFRATDVRALASAADPVGPENAEHLNAIIREADVLVPCWGKVDKVPRALRGRFDWLREGILASGKPVRIFGRAKCGSPLHPLMLAYSTPLVEWARR